MSDYEKVVSELLTEAGDLQTDQILLISRTDQSHLYFLANGRVKKAVPLELNWAHEVVQKLSGTEGPVRWVNGAGKELSFECKVYLNDLGECFAMNISEDRPDS